MFHFPLLKFKKAQRKPFTSFALKNLICTSADTSVFYSATKIYHNSVNLSIPCKINTAPR